MIWTSLDEKPNIKIFNHLKIQGNGSHLTNTSESQSFNIGVGYPFYDSKNSFMGMIAQVGYSRTTNANSYFIHEELPQFSPFYFTEILDNEGNSQTVGGIGAPELHEFNMAGKVIFITKNTTGHIALREVFLSNEQRHRLQAEFINRISDNLRVNTNLNSLFR